MTLDRVPEQMLRQLSALDEAMDGAVVAMIRARLLLVAAGSRPANLDAVTLFAELQTLLDRDRRRRLN